MLSLFAISVPRFEHWLCLLRDSPLSPMPLVLFATSVRMFFFSSLRQDLQIAIFAIDTKMKLNSFDTIKIEHLFKDMKVGLHYH